MFLQFPCPYFFSLPSTLPLNSRWLRAQRFVSQEDQSSDDHEQKCAGFQPLLKLWWLAIQCFQLKEWIFFKLLYRTSLQSFNIHIPFLHHPNNVSNSKTACLENGKWRTALFSFTLIHFTPFFFFFFFFDVKILR